MPVIDLAQPDRDELASQIHSACMEWGFFQITGHGVAPATSAAMLAAARGFFAQSSAEKRRISRTADNPWGFFDAELTKNTPDWKEIVDIGPERDGQTPQWPAQPDGFRPALEAYTAQLERIARALLRIVLANLGDTYGQELAGFQSDTSFLFLRPLARSNGLPYVDTIALKKIDRKNTNVKNTSARGVSKPSSCVQASKLTEMKIKSARHPRV